MEENIIISVDKDFSLLDIQEAFGTCRDISIPMNEFYEALMSSYLVVVAYNLEGKIIGLVQVIGDSRWKAMINFVYTAPKFRKHGVASKLLKIAVENTKHINEVCINANTPEIVSICDKLDFETVEDGCLLIHRGTL